jgi:hypothetical protein
MFEYLSPYRIVLVSGPHRSGTTITTKMIAHDTGARYCPEEVFGHDNHKGWLALIADPERKVIQCPSMCVHLEGPGIADDVAVVIVFRSLADIIASQESIGWGPTGQYAGRYKAELIRYGGNEGESLAFHKYLWWGESQQHIISHPSVVNYEDLSSHPLWLPKSARANFGPRQVAL